MKISNNIFQLLPSPRKQGSRRQKKDSRLRGRDTVIGLSLGILLAGPAFAQNPAMNYIVMPKAPQKPVVDDVTMSAPDQNNKTDEKSKIWAHYKDLAAGTAESQNPGISESQKEEKQRPESSNAQKAPTGLAGLIQQYHENKKRQSQMRTITMNPPELPETKE